MPRQARKKSESGIYHAMLRGINQQQIFEDAEDCDKFIQILQECKAISGFKLFAYCLMGNHIHLLIKPEDEPIEQVFKRIGATVFPIFLPRPLSVPAFAPCACAEQAGHGSPPPPPQEPQPFRPPPIPYRLRQRREKHP